MLLSICIPTYNREKDIANNINKIAQIIEENNLKDIVDIYISDNCSTDNTQTCVGELIRKFENIVKITYDRNPINTGIGQNIKKPLFVVDTEYIMLLGDDDYISKEYLLGVINYINEGAVCIVPSYQNITPEGELMTRGRDIGKVTKTYKKGFKSCVCNMWRGHQMSGLVFNTKEIRQHLNNDEISNPYPQVLMVGTGCYSGKSVHFTDYPILVTRPHQSKKDFSYGDNGYIDEFFNNFKLLKEVNSIGRFILELNFLYNQYWRFAMYLKKGPKSFLKCIASIEKSKNTTLGTKILLPLWVPIILVMKAVELLVSGKLFSTLKTKVDV